MQRVGGAVGVRVSGVSDEGEDNADEDEDDDGEKTLPWALFFRKLCLIGRVAYGFSSTAFVDGLGNIKVEDEDGVGQIVVLFAPVSSVDGDLANEGVLTMLSSPFVQLVAASSMTEDSLAEQNVVVRVLSFLEVARRG
ncbi:hypothetical protein SUGI_0766120 [Cryptomeria japonica]|nr:hypothetical protein SUGI_0766120 [Cryptomeria japonica]